MNKSRKWWAACLLSVLQPGLGQFYNGHARKGALIIAIHFLLLFSTALLLSTDKLLLILGLFATVGTGFLLYVVADAIASARKIGATYTLKGYNRTWVYLGIFLTVSALTSLTSTYIKSNHVQAFSIPSRSNAPTLLPGDHILVDRTTEAKSPTHGSLVVFQSPEKPGVDYVKRIVAIGGDEIEIKDKVLFVNGAQVNEPYAQFLDTANKRPNASARNVIPKTMVPEASYYVLGDNRDYSFDSRDFGFVPAKDIKGTVKKIYWSWDSDLGQLRWSRIGSSIQ